ncbi:sensor histidine kinase [Nocardioides sp. Kera G14]|uniref:HAMP domain-containing sensor histidine kinase n=1 Tax=Nocardioides sp. Kera G14 TaxID=2884264 RepID=UPI001D100ABE|nr:HAMP domain-containing sensor histidine kinase [Nocardioides sp. Kera G14]UDY23315.1 HAMP domain-containing histidine kinase [Nocardioides sp. Kera G14]
MRNFRTRLVLSTVLLVGAVMVGVVLVLRVALELTEGEQRKYASDHVFYTMLVMAAVTVALVGVVAWVTTRRVLDPVRQMAERAEEWSARDLGHRFALGAPVDEFAQLGQTLDHLLDRVAQAIRDEQRLTSELAHELRTPLTAIQGSAEIALFRLGADADRELRDDLAEIATAAARMSDTITTLLELARRGTVAGSSSLYEVPPALEVLVPPHVRFSADLAAGLPQVAAPTELVVRALAPLIDNAGRHASSAVTLTARRTEGGVELVVRDDGAGVPAALQATLFEPGTTAGEGTGLGLGISRRIARSLGGDVTLARHGDGNGRETEFVLRLPVSGQAASSRSAS